MAGLMSGLTHMMTVAGPWGNIGCFSGVYMLTKLWPAGRDFSPFVSLLPDGLSQEVICSVRSRVNVTQRYRTSCAVLAHVGSKAAMPCAE